MTPAGLLFRESGLGQRQTASRAQTHQPMAIPPTDVMTMNGKHLLSFAAALVLAAGACHRAEPGGLSPNTLRELAVPAAGLTEAEVIALNGAPDRREPTDAGEVWVYARLHPRGTGIESKTATVWFRDGVVVDAAVTTGFSTSVPTLPSPRAAHR